jgi:Sulfotransferase domain
MLPNLIIIGAGRCGTTSLHYYLGEHPEIFMAEKKELMFFVREANWRRGASWYERQFPNDAPVRGEASPQYSLYQRYEGVPERMAGLVPEAKLVYLVRDPFDRLFSQYALSHSFGHDRRTLAEALASDDRGFYVDAGRYASQLERYLEHFPREHILVLETEELRRRRREVLRSVFTFLDVDPTFESPTFSSVHNVAPEREGRAVFRRFGGAAQAAVGFERYRRLLARAPRALRPVFTTPHRTPQLDPRVRAELEAIFREDTARLRELTGLTLVDWSV